MATKAAKVKYGSSLLREGEIQISYLYPDGYLFLVEDPLKWIQANPADCLSVRRLELKFLKNVEEISDSIMELSQLTHLCFNVCYSLKYIPTTITRLANLQFLKISYCKKVLELPPKLGELKKSLTHLSLVNCSAIKFLPSSITELHKLIDLELDGCNNLSQLPQSLGDLVQLLHLRIRVGNSYSNGRSGIKSLPGSTTKLCNLQTLVVPYHFNLKTLLQFRMNDSVLVTVDSSGIPEKTWSEFRKEFGQKIINGTFKPPNFCPGLADGLLLRSILLHNKRLKYVNSIEEPTQVTQGITNQKTSPLNLPVAGATSSPMEQKSEEFRVEWSLNNKGKQCHDAKKITRENNLVKLVDAADELAATRTPLKRKLEEFVMVWPSNKEIQCHNAKKRTHNMESPSGSCFSELNPTGHGHVEECLDRASQHTQSDHVPKPFDATTGTVKEPSMAIQERGSLSYFVVKATYEEDTVRFDISSTLSFDELEKEVAKNLKLELSKFKIKYQDEDEEWMLMTMDSHLKYILGLVKSSAKNVVRLLITSC